MWDFVGFAIRNPSHVTRNARRSWETRKAMKAYHEAHPACEATGRTDDTQVHHVYPVSIRPELAGDPSNFITLHKDAHRILGHGGNWKDYNPNVRETARSMNIVRTRGA